MTSKAESKNWANEYDFHVSKDADSLRSLLAYDELSFLVVAYKWSINGSLMAY